MVVVTEQRRPTLQDAQDALQSLGRATRKTLAERLGCSKWLAGEIIDELCEAGVVRRCTFERTGKRGRPAPIFELVPPPRAVAMELRSGLGLPEVVVDVKPLKDLRDRPVKGCTLAEIAPPKIARKQKPRKVKPSTGRKVKRRKGKLGTDEVLAKAAELGYTVSTTRKGHYRFDRDDIPSPLFGSSNPGDYRGVKNTIASLERGYAA